MNDKKKILIADDSELNREMLMAMLSEEYEIITACNGVEAVVAIQKYGVGIDLILLDIVMPKMDGFQVLEAMKENNWIEEIPVIMISAVNTPSVIHRAFENGVVDYICRPFDAAVVKKRVSNTVRLFEKQKALAGMVAEQIYEKEKSGNLMITILSHIVEFRNGESGLHVLHINTITRILLQHLLEKTDKYNLTHEDINLISMASALHDIGKISIPDHVLNKPARLTREEFEILKTHASVGAEILKSLPFQNEPLVKYAYDICRWHHERYDGGGYPDRLVGEEIPIWAQVVSIADVYDALTSERVYKRAYSHEVAMAMIFNNECGVFNPIILECLKECEDAIRQEISDTNEKMLLSGKTDVKNVVRELSMHKELSTQERAYDMLEKEKTRNDFIFSVSDEMFFEYQCESQILTLSPKAADLFSVAENTFNPVKNANLAAVLEYNGGEKLVAAVKEAPIANPVVEMNFSVENKGVYRLSARAICEKDTNKPVYIIGRFSPVS